MMRFPSIPLPVPLSLKPPPSDTFAALEIVTFPRATSLDPEKETPSIATFPDGASIVRFKLLNMDPDFAKP